MLSRRDQRSGVSGGRAGDLFVRSCLCFPTLRARLGFFVSDPTLRSVVSAESALSPSSSSQRITRLQSFGRLPNSPPSPSPRCRGEGTEWDGALRDGSHPLAAPRALRRSAVHEVGRAVVGRLRFSAGRSALRRRARPSGRLLRRQPALLPAPPLPARLFRLGPGASLCRSRGTRSLAIVLVPEDHLPPALRALAALVLSRPGAGSSLGARSITPHRHGYLAAQRGYSSWWRRSSS